MKKSAILVFSICLFLSGCDSFQNKLTPTQLSDINWKNGIWIQKDGKHGFFITADFEKVKVPTGTKLTFAKSGARIVTEVVSSPPYINIFVDKPLDPDGDGFPNKILIN